MRKLSLRKDVLTELTTDELALVAGGQEILSNQVCLSGICLTDPCITPPVTGIWCLTRDPACS